MPILSLYMYNCTDRLEGVLQASTPSTSLAREEQVEVGALGDPTAEFSEKPLPCFKGQTTEMGKSAD